MAPCVVGRKALDAGAVVGKLPDSVHRQIDNLFEDSLLLGHPAVRLNASLEAYEQRIDRHGCLGEGETKCACVLVVVRARGVAFNDSGWVRQFATAMLMLLG